MELLYSSYVYEIVLEFWIMIVTANDKRVYLSTINQLCLLYDILLSRKYQIENEKKKLVLINGFLKIHHSIALHKKFIFLIE